MKLVNSYLYTAAQWADRQKISKLNAFRCATAQPSVSSTSFFLQNEPAASAGGAYFYPNACADASGGAYGHQNSFPYSSGEAYSRFFSKINRSPDQIVN